MKSKFTWIFTLLVVFFIQTSFAQQKTITGVVSDESGIPLPGVSVLVEGTNRGAQTDFDGKYSVKASVGEKLIFSYISMISQTVRVGASSTISPILKNDVTELGAVEIVGYGVTRPKTQSNVAVSTVSAKTIEGRPNASFMQTLQAQIPGLNISTGSGQPGSSSQVILRGVGSINGNIEPLFIIDGVPLNADNFRSINPSDIESVSVLKDAGATSIYGNRGANGVVIVKTKQGSFESALKVKFSSITSFSELQQTRYNLMNSKQILATEKAVGRGLGGTLTLDEINNFAGANTSWYDALFRTGLTNNQVLSLSSGSKNMSSFTSFGFFDQEGIVPSTDLKRFNFRNNLSGKSNNDKFNYSTSLTVNYSVRNEVSNLGEGSVNINPLVGGNQGLPYLSPSDYPGSGQGLFDLFNTGMPGIPAASLAFTPLLLLDVLDSFVSETSELKMIGQTQASYKLTNDLTFGSALGLDYTQATGLRVQDPKSFNSLLFQETGEDFLGFQTESFAREFAANVNTSLSYNKTFAEKHTIDLAAYTEYYKAHLKSFSATQRGLNDKVFEPGNGAGYIPHNPSGNPALYVPGVASGKATAGLFSYFGTVDYDYDRKYGFGASVRRDASYRFAETNRWGTFWSVSGRWNIDQEAFMENSWFSMLKLRASYGTAGNQNISGQSIFAAANASRTLYAAGSSYGNQASYVLGQLGNADLKWETVEQANIGADFELLSGKLRGTTDVYQKITRDLYQDSPISGVNGTYTIDANNGDLRNRGVELQLAYDLVKSNDFVFTLNFNGSYNQNQLLTIPTEGGEVQVGDFQVNKEGDVLNQFYLIRYAGVNPANGNLLFLDANGLPTETPDPDADRVYTGKSAQPTYQGGFGFDTSYKGFFATASFSFVADIHRFDFDLEGLQDPSDIGIFNKSQDLLNAWTPDNRVTDIPSLNLTNKGSDTYSDRYLKDASYVRLRYLSVGYEVPKKFLERTFLSNVRTFFQAENLVTWSKWRGWDAESPRGSDVYQYPTPKILSVGLELEF